MSAKTPNRHLRRIQANFPELFPLTMINPSLSMRFQPLCVQKNTSFIPNAFWVLVRVVSVSSGGIIHRQPDFQGISWFLYDTYNHQHHLNALFSRDCRQKWSQITLDRPKASFRENPPYRFVNQISSKLVGVRKNWAPYENLEQNPWVPMKPEFWFCVFFRQLSGSENFETPNHQHPKLREIERLVSIFFFSMDLRIRLHRESWILLYFPTHQKLSKSYEYFFRKLVHKSIR